MTDPVTDNESRLLAKAEEFAGSLSKTVSEFVGEEYAFQAEYSQDRVSIGLKDDLAVLLKVGGKVHLSLTISIFASWGSAGQFLAVDNSSYAVYAGPRPRKEPLFRYDFNRHPNSWCPGAHIQVHAHRDAFTHAMSSAGRVSKRGRRHEGRDPDDTPALSEFHFPVGGRRFRPCLEDVLESLRQEFGLDTGDNWKSVLRDGRVAWRKTQLAAAVRDCPEVAVKVLRELGVDVSGEVPECAESKFSAL